MMQLLVVADDYTGALDTGTQFAKRGVSARLFLYDSRLTADDLRGCGAQVAVVDTESRHLPPGEAARRVHGAALLAREAGCQYFFKKTDSALRGNLGSELEALRSVCGASQLYFVPAYPALGRTTVRGVHRVNGVPIARTEFADDPFNPIRHSNVAALLKEQGCRAVRTAEAGQVLGSLGEPEIVVVDGQTDADLVKTSRALAAAGRLTCTAGCAGFASALPEGIPFQTAPVRWRPRAGGILLVSGSIHPQSVRQCGYAVRQCGFLDCPLSLRQMLSDGDACAGLADAISDTLRGGKKVLLRVPGGRELLRSAAELAEELHLDKSAVPGRIAGTLGRVAADILRRSQVSVLIVFGGDTLMGIASALRCKSVIPLAEPLPGVALSQMQLPSGTIDLITKAGGFGSDGLLADLEGRLSDLMAS